MLMMRRALPCPDGSFLLPRGHWRWGLCQVGFAPQSLHQCHGKSEALIFVLDCSSPVFITGTFRCLCSHRLEREVLGGDGGVERWLSQLLGVRT
jgi:hypothetical protein